MASDSPGKPVLEIERKWLLRCMPVLPKSSVALQIEQGYLGSASPDPSHPGWMREGARLRRTTWPDGSIICHHTIKRGKGLVREENERVLDRDEFESLWPQTINLRIHKVRHVVEEEGFTWEIDEFIEPAALVLAEVELPSVETVATPPDWLVVVIDREVTDEMGYTNRAIAERLQDAGPRSEP